MYLKDIANFKAKTRVNLDKPKWVDTWLDTFLCQVDSNQRMVTPQTVF